MALLSASSLAASVAVGDMGHPWLAPLAALPLALLEPRVVEEGDLAVALLVFLVSAASP